jgi:phospholipase C
MSDVNRRRFLQMAGGTVAASMLSDSIARAASIPANRTTRSLEDVEHIVVLMQENRSFDHYYGVLRGVRGFGDPHPVTLPAGNPVWYQADGGNVTLPFRPDVEDLALVFIEDLAHDWDTTHEAFDAGNWDQWIPSKGTTSMAHLERKDLPFHYALADAFTICDAYHCSMLGPTDTNRYYMWTGWDGNNRTGGGPVIGNDELGYDWKTYPERLLNAGIDWKVYQDIGTGLNAAGSWGWTDDPYIGNYGDNSLLYFDAYRNAQPGSELYTRALSGTDVSKSGTFFDQLAADVKNNQLPKISWVVAPEAYTEHPAWPAGYGAWYTAQVLNALTSNPDVWSKTALLITFDENDGFFDHVIGPYPNVGGLAGDSTVSTKYEWFNGTPGLADGSSGTPGPYGMGVRVPMLVVSPWSTGGWVCSETLDHTSVIRLMEARYGVSEPNITPWRRAVAGDLTAAFDFASSSDRVPKLPSTAAYKPDPNATVPDDYVPTPPKVGSVPRQEPGTRPSRRLGYAFDVQFSAEASALKLGVKNSGKLGIGLQARSLTVADAPYSYTVGSGHNLDAQLPNPGTYDLSVYGPNGFFRRYSGSPATLLSVSQALNPGSSSVAVTITASGADDDFTVQVTDAYNDSRDVVLRGGKATFTVKTGQSGGWYDLSLSSASDPSFSYQLAGRLESSGDLTSDPQLS